MERLIIKLSTLILIVIAQGCYYDAENYLYPSNSACDSVKGVFSTEVKPLMDVSCKSCHSTAAAATSGGSIILETYDQIKANNAKIISTINAATMPKGGAKLPVCEIRKIQKWFDNGMPNN